MHANAQILLELAFVTAGVGAAMYWEHKQSGGRRLMPRPVRKHPHLSRR